MKTNFDTTIIKLDEKTNNIYMKRDDLIPFSFGGNKVRKAMLFFQEIDEGEYDAVVTYGSSSSNHGRIVSNMAKSRELDCYIISPEEAFHETNNSKIMEMFGAKIITSPLNKVSACIDSTIKTLTENGKKPYFIQGGGHGYLGTKSYVDCYEEIKRYELENDVFFDYIFFASGTGATQAGLVCGQLINNDERKIVGISIARKLPRGRDVVLESINEYLKEEAIHISEDKIEENTIFTDKYICGGYGDFDADVKVTINEIMMRYGIPLDSTYTGKAYTGMKKYLLDNSVSGKNVLFIHTGGTPLFFDYLSKE